MRSFTALGAAVLVAALLIIALAAAFVIGSIRYGGPNELVQRVRAEIALFRPHPEFVPTPLPTPTGLDVVPTVWQPALTPAPALLPAAAPMPALPVRPTVATAPPTPTPVPPRARPVPPPAVQLTGLTHMWQKWNNCAPATLAMYLSHFGAAPTQDDLALALKGTPDDKNVSPDEVSAYVKSQGLSALVRVNGDLDRLRLFLSNGMPVMLETWLEDGPNNGMGHYRLVTGYDDTTRQFTVFDSYVSAGVRSDQPYEGIRIGYDDLLKLWTVFNRTYILVYRPEKAPLVASILGADAGDAVMRQRALAQAQLEVKGRPKDPFAWFNLATEQVALGQYDEAAKNYGTARVIGLPWRMLWYQFGPFRAYYQTGQYEELTALANATIRTRGDVEEVYYWKGLGLAAAGDVGEARKAWQQALQFNARFADAATALTATAQSPQKDPLLFTLPAAAHGG